MRGGGSSMAGESKLEELLNPPALKNIYFNKTNANQSGMPFLGGLP
jgi:hypothetical protein